MDSPVADGCTQADARSSDELITAALAVAALMPVLAGDTDIVNGSREDGRGWGWGGELVLDGRVALVVGPLAGDAVVASVCGGLFAALALCVVGPALVGHVAPLFGARGGGTRGTPPRAV